MLSWFRRPPDPLEDRARELAIVLDRRLADALPEIQVKIPALATTRPATWAQHATIAAAALTVFPLLRAVQGDPDRYRRLVDLLRSGLRDRYAAADQLWKEAEHATVPPTGQEQTRTLHEIDESQSLALAQWVLHALGDRSHRGDSWQPTKLLAKILRQSAEGYWKAAR
jgi:hypothetical protein